MLGLNADAVLHSPATQEHPPSSAEPLTGVRALVVGAAVASALLVWAVTSLLHDTGVSVPESPGSDQRPAVETSTVARDVGRRSRRQPSPRHWPAGRSSRCSNGSPIERGTGVAIAVLVLRLPYLPAFTATERVVLVQLHGVLAAPLILGMRGPGRAGLCGCGPPANDRSAVRETLTTMDAEPDPGAQAQAERQAQAMYAEDRASQGLGIAITDVAPGRATATLLVTAAMVNGHGTCHGGYLFLLADTAFAFACNTHGDPAVAAGADVTFLAAVHEGEHLVAEAVERIVHGRSGLYDVTVRRDGQPVVEFRGRSRTLSGRRPTPPPT